MATRLFKAHCSVRGWIFHRISESGMWADFSLTVGAGGISGDPSPMMIELEMNLLLFLCTPLYGIGLGKAVV